jgi:alanine racemase
MRTWAEVDLDALEHNYRLLREALPPNCRFLGVVKADAYGHGAVPIARRLVELGAEMLAVATLAEGLELRRAGIDAPILCLGKTPMEFAPLLLEHAITQMVENMDDALALSQAAVAARRHARVHIKLDTGMSRLGFRWRADGDNGPLLDKLVALCALPGLEVEGMFTHFANADEDEAFTMLQLTGFLDARAALQVRGIFLSIYHCAASAAVLNYPCTHLDMVRPGIALYGYDPTGQWAQFGLRAVITVKSRIAAVHELPAGAVVSYGCTATLRRDSRVAVVPIGYGDGYPRSLSGQMHMRVNGAQCPILGRVCMDMCMLDVTDLPQVAPGDVAVLYGPELTQRAADLTHTIVYELLCRLARRIPRLYFRQGEQMK